MEQAGTGWNVMGYNRVPWDDLASGSGVQGQGFRVKGCESWIGVVMMLLRSLDNYEAEMRQTEDVAVIGVFWCQKGGREWVCLMWVISPNWIHDAGNHLLG